MRSHHLVVVVRRGGHHAAVIGGGRGNAGDLDDGKLTLDDVLVAVVEHSPDVHEVLKLAHGLLDLGVGALDSNGHTAELLDVGRADGKRVNVEAASAHEAGDLGEHTGGVIHEHTHDVLLGLLLHGRRVVQDVVHGVLRRALALGAARDTNEGVQALEACRVGARRGGQAAHKAAAGHGGRTGALALARTTQESRQHRGFDCELPAVAN